jgi:hypothetical protein
MKNLLLGIVLGIVGGILAFGLAIIEGIGAAFGAAGGSVSPSSYIVFGIIPVVATACLSRFIGRIGASVAAVIPLGVVVLRCRNGYQSYLHEGGVWAQRAPEWLSLITPIIVGSVLLSAVAIVALAPKRNEKSAS